MNRHERRAWKRRLRGVQLTIDITIGKGEKAATTKHTVDSDDMPLILLEAMEAGRIKDMREGIADLLELSEEQSRQLTTGHLKQIAKAIKAAAELPND